MKTNVSKAQLEVWEIKERLYNEIKDLPVGERIAYIIKKTKATVESLKRKRRKK